MERVLGTIQKRQHGANRGREMESEEKMIIFILLVLGFLAYLLHSPKLLEYCEQIEPPVRMIEPASAINRATQCERESH